MKVLINITYDGQNGDYRCDMDPNVSDDDTVRRVCEEALRGGEVQGIDRRDVGRGVFANFVVDRFGGAGERETRFVVRPKVPFGK